MRTLERELLGADHGAFGAGLCEAWKFPSSFSYIAGHHHDPMSLPEGSRTLASIVYVADRITAEAGYGFRADLQDTTIDPAILEELKLPASELESVRTKLPEAIADVETTFA